MNKNYQLKPKEKLEDAKSTVNAVISVIVNLSKLAGAMALVYCALKHVDTVMYQRGVLLVAAILFTSFMYESVLSVRNK